MSGSEKLQVSLPDEMVELLRAPGVEIDPSLVSALCRPDGLKLVNDLSFEYPLTACASRRRLGGLWSPGTGPEPLPLDERSLFWPLGRGESKTVIVVVGLDDGLFLASLLHRVGVDGEIFRRPGCPPILEDAAIVALPETAPGVALEWFADPELGVDDLLSEIVTLDTESVVLAFPRDHVEVLDPLTDAFIDRLLEVGPETALLPIALRRPTRRPWATMLAHHSRATKRHAFATLVDYQVANARDEIEERDE